jgi:hypothetical protein
MIQPRTTRRLRRLLAAGAIVFFTVAACGEETQTNASLRLAVDLVDGSHIIGVPTVSSISIQTAYAKIDLPIRQIRSVAKSKDHEKATVTLWNGDRLNATLMLDCLEMITGFGKVSLNVNHVAFLRVCREGGIPLPEHLKDSLVLYYPFDEDEGDVVTDYSWKTDPGDIVGATWVRSGKIGGAYDFDGRSNQIATPAVDVTNDMTWSVWIYPRSFPSQFDTWAQFMGARGHAWPGGVDSGLRFSKQASYGGSRMALEFVVYTAQKSEQKIQKVLMKLPDVNRWYHVAGVAGSNGMRLYLDGNLLSESAENVKIAAASPLIIGGSGSLRQWYFDGLIDEVMVFKKALSTDDIKTLYESMK